ncbi:serine protease grass [Drosophila sechellia]|uniref:GM15715 n=1 Tax=Drosophila sechellia TaxID=7238 RepID=B4I7R3_DROSE|nr:serine protease grass [Drosophila sechellia]EDW56638.1 GM15715 [Drosophila sechellia]
MYWILLLGFHFSWHHHATAQFLEPDCGYLSLEALQNEEHQAHISESPWMAYLHKSGEFVCGGTLINHQFVLTAAHCIREDENLTVRLGEFNSLTSIDCNGSNCLPPSEDFEIDLAFRHRGYSRTNKIHDIGLLRLAKSVEYKVHIKPICLITNKTLQPKIERLHRLVATGWGRSPSETPNHILKSIRVIRVNGYVCSDTYWVDRRRDQICVSHESGVSCSGDSGGPLGHAIRLNGRVVFVQVGIVSYGNAECLSPSVFTNVMEHIDWIMAALSTSHH